MGKITKVKFMSKSGFNGTLILPAKLSDKLPSCLTYILIKKGSKFFNVIFQFDKIYIKLFTVENIFKNKYLCGTISAKISECILI